MIFLPLKFVIIGLSLEKKDFYEIINCFCCGYFCIVFGTIKNKIKKPRILNLFYGKPKKKNMQKTVYKHNSLIWNLLTYILLLLRKTNSKYL